MSVKIGQISSGKHVQFKIINNYDIFIYVYVFSSCAADNVGGMIQT